MKIEELLLEKTKEFIEYWNIYNFEALELFLREDVVIYSPNIHLVYPEIESGKLVGRKTVIQYWKILQNEVAKYQFELEGFFKNGQTIHTVSKIVGTPQKLYTSYLYDQYGKIKELKFEYK